ncbi:hypothetical protein ABZP36_026055 [Zizania latifolia]
MSKKSASGHIGSDEVNVEEPSIGRLIAFLFLINFAGLFVIIPLRKTMIIRHRLTQQVVTLFKSLGGTVLWPLLQWFFAGGKNCGFQAFPTFGITAYRRGFYFDFSMANIGVGMICPPMITTSMLV